MKCDCLQFIFRLPSVHFNFLRFATEGEPLASTHWYGAGPGRHEKHEWPHEERHVFQDAAQCGRIPELCIQLLGHSAWTSDCLLCNIAADPVCIFLRQNRWLSKTLQNMSHMSDPCWAQVVFGPQGSQLPFDFLLDSRILNPNWLRHHWRRRPRVASVSSATMWT